MLGSGPLLSASELLLDLGFSNHFFNVYEALDVRLRSMCSPVEAPRYQLSPRLHEYYTRNQDLETRPLPYHLTEDRATKNVVLVRTILRR